MSLALIEQLSALGEDELTHEAPVRLSKSFTAIASAGASGMKPQQAKLAPQNAATEAREVEASLAASFGIQRQA